MTTRRADTHAPPAIAPEELHRYHEAPARGVRAKQYAYEIGSYHYNWHPEIELSLVLTGEIEVCAEGSLTVVGPGDVYCINANEGHATLARQPRSVVLLLHLDPAHLAGLAGGEEIPRFACRTTPATRESGCFVRLRELLATMALTHDPSPAGIAAWESLLLEVVSILFGSVSAPGAARGVPGEVAAQDKAVARAVAYVDKNFRERITLEHLGRAARYHPTYLSQLFSQQLGMTASEYISRVRLREATRDLHDPTARVADVAIANGFPDVKAFNVAFRRTFGRTPSEYRRCVTDAATAGDEGFRERFVRRADPFVRAALESFAGLADAPLTGPDLQLQCQLAEVSALAQEISARLGHLASQ